LGYSIIIDPRAIREIREAMDYYDEQQAGLGQRFEAELNKNLLKLQKNPFFRIRYDKVRCLPVKKFPYLVHYTVDEANNLIFIHAVFHTSRDPAKWIGDK
jgi:toxin ParE1/3/4